MQSKCIGKVYFEYQFVCDTSEQFSGDNKQLRSKPYIWNSIWSIERLRWSLNLPYCSFSSYLIIIGCVLSKTCKDFHGNAFTCIFETYQGDTKEMYQINIGSPYECQFKNSCHCQLLRFLVTQLLTLTYSTSITNSCRCFYYLYF